MDKANIQREKYPEKIETKLINNYNIIKRIGFGSSGLVYKVTRKDDPSNKIYILKQIPYSEPNLEETTKKANSARNEASILSKLSCKYIVKYYDSFIDSDFNLNIIMEYCDNGDLNTYIQNQKKLKKYLPENEIWNFFIQISLGLAYIHSKKILHRDLKPMNIFLTKKNEIKIGDLGVAKFLNNNSNAVTCIGTPYYLSPEICKEKPYNSKGDVWALGCILYELCTFEKPYSASNPAALILKIINGNYTPLNEIKNGMKYSKELQKMIEITLQKDYLIRPLMIDIINSKIFEEKANLYGFKNDLINIRNLYQDNNDSKTKDNIEHMRNIIGDKNKQNKKSEVNFRNDNDIIILNSEKKDKRKGLTNQKNVYINNFYKKNKKINNNNNKNDGPYIRHIKAKGNYLTSGKSTKESSHNNDLIIQNKNKKISDKSKIANKKNYLKYITKQENIYPSSENNLKIKNINSDKKNNKNNQKFLMNTRLKLLKIVPIDYRDRSEKKKNKNTLRINRNLFFDESLSNKNSRVNSGDKKYINLTKNDIYNKDKKYLVKNNNKKNRAFYNPFQDKIKSNNIKVKNNHNMNILNPNNYQNALTNYNCQNQQNKMNLMNINNINNMNIKYSLNLIEKTRSNFYSNKYEKFINMKTPIDSIKMKTQNCFNNLHQFRIENGFEDTENYKNLIGYEINNENKYSKAYEDSSDDTDCNVDSNINEEDILIDDSEQEDDNNIEEEKVSIVKENNNNNKINDKKELLEKYNDCKNKILLYKNVIDINEFFSMYEKMSKNKVNKEEIDNYIKNNLSGDKHSKLRKLFKQFIYYDVELQNLNYL